MYGYKIIIKGVFKLKIRKLYSVVFIIMFCLILIACNNESNEDNGKNSEETSGEIYKIKIGHAGSEQTLMHRGLEVFKESAEEESDGQLEIEIFPNGQLGGDVELQTAVQSGDITMTASS